jgi:peptidoglycan hydrolase-like protein with peptidoglycan-binding domain
VTRQEITRERTEISFETLCPPSYTADFVSSLQRALALRGFYTGLVTGIMDIPTGRAVQDFQRVDGPDSPILSIDTARALGLTQLTAEQIDSL